MGDKELLLVCQLPFSKTEGGNWSVKRVFFFLNRFLAEQPFLLKEKLVAAILPTNNKSMTAATKNIQSAVFFIVLAPENGSQSHGQLLSKRAVWDRARFYHVND